MQYPEMREELIGTLKALSDRQYQKKAWIQKQYPEGIVYDCFDYAVHFLFDDTSLAEKPEKLIGVILEDEYEAALVRAVASSIERLLAETGDDLTDEAYIRSPMWENVIRTAKTAYHVVIENQNNFQEGDAYYEKKYA
ncbi:hypothetical protein QUF72_05105 [Desulfobacterales bacterium HSG2]|nr:hypothetical protein [Desulfobacterales bacterium HSG2]